MSSLLINPGAMSPLPSRTPAPRRLTPAKPQIALAPRGATEDSMAPRATPPLWGGAAGLKHTADSILGAEAALAVARRAAEAVAGLLQRLKDSIAAGTRQGEVDGIVDQIGGVAAAAQIDGVSLLASRSPIDLVPMAAAAAGGAVVPGVTLVQQDLRIAPGGGLGAVGAIDVTTQDGAASAAAIVDAAIAVAAEAVAVFAGAQDRLATQHDFVAALADALGSGSGGVSIATTDEDAVRLLALQVQQELGEQPLSIANAAPQSILALLR